MSDKAKDNSKDNSNSLSEAEKFLESLNLPDNQSTNDANTATTSDPNDLMSFLDEISKYPSEEEEKEEKKPSTEKTTVKEQEKKQEQQQETGTTEAPEEPKQADGWMSWGNSVWNQASAAVKSTTDQINRSIPSDSTTSKRLEERVKMLQGFVNKENIEKLGKKNEAWKKGGTL
jgi:hypothetical protein